MIFIGHVDPNEINNEDPDAQDTTFTLTNVAPQASIFNGRAHHKDFLEFNERCVIIFQQRLF